MFTYARQINYYETDKMGITHHSNYIKFMEEARIAFLESVGISYDSLEKANIFSPVVSVQCNYKKSTTFKDKIEIQVSVTEVTHATLTISYTMTKNGTVVCTATSEHCFINADGKIIRLEQVSADFYQKILSLKK